MRTALKHNLSLNINMKGGGKKIYSLYDLSIESMYPTKPKIKKNNWKKWLETADSDLITFIKKIRKSYNDIKKLGLQVIEVVEAPTTDNGYWITQYPFDYAKATYPKLYQDKNNTIPHIIIRYKINNNLHLETDYLEMCICGNIINVSDIIKTNLENYMNNNFPNQFSLINTYENNYRLFFCLKNPNK